MDGTRTDRRTFLRRAAGVVALGSTGGCLNLQEPDDRPGTAVSTPTETPTHQTDTRPTSPAATATVPADVRGPARWVRRTRAPVRQRPVATNGLVLVGSTDRHLYAFDAADGSQEWVVEFETEPLFTVADDAVVVLGDYRVYALDVATGAIRWENASTATSYRPLVVDDTVFLAARSRIGVRVVARSLSSGDVQWLFTERDTDERTFVVAQPAYQDGLVCVVAGKGGQRPSTHSAAYGIDADTGEKRWQTAVDANVGELNVASAGGYAVSGGRDGTLHGFDTATGEHVWRRDDLDAYFVTAVGGTVYAGGDRFRALDPATGRTEWAFSGREIDSFAAPAVHDGAFVVPANGRLYELSADGRRRGAVEIVDEVSTGAAADDTGVYVGAEDASVYAYRHPDT